MGWANRVDSIVVSATPTTDTPLAYRRLYGRLVGS